jgi:hypothetical protein
VEPEPEPNKEPDVEAMIRRDALILLVKRHEDEYKDLLVMERYRRRPNKGTKADQGKSWVSAGRI